jgi:hypothetical protein
MFKNKSNIKPSLGSTINTNHPLAQGLVGCWLFNEQIGNKIYGLSKDNHGSLMNGPVWNSQNNGYLQFDGSNDYIDLGTSIQNYSVFTTSIWINFNFFDNSHRSPLGDDSQQYLYHILFLNTYIYVAFSSGASWSYGGVLHGTIDINTWYNFVVTKNSDNTITFYKNGKLLGYSTALGSANLNKIVKGYVHDNAKI